MIELRSVTGHKGDYQNHAMTAADALDLGPAQSAEFAVLTTEPGWALHELDFKSGRAVFLDVGAETNLFAAPFAYNAHIAAARRHASLPLDQFVELGSSLQTSHRWIELFNPGHCGSTLLHHVFSAGGEAWSLSEPQFAFNLSMHADHLPVPQRVELIRACHAFAGLYPFARDRKVLVLKHFSQATKYYGIWNAALPAATNIYLHRDVLSWCNSVYGFAQRMGMPARMPRNERSFVWMIMTGAIPESYLEGILDMDGPDVRFEDFAAIAWALHAQQYRQALDDGTKIPMFSYEDLSRKPAETVRRIFAACGLSEANISKALTAFDHDSHEGERSSRDKPVEKLGAEAQARIMKILEHPKLWVEEGLRNMALHS